MKVKGEKNGLCNREACQSPHKVIWYNHSTRKYYCESCGIMLNQVNKKDAMELLGHDLCTTGEEE